MRRLKIEKYINMYLNNYKDYKSEWNYEDGCILIGAESLYKATKDKKYLDLRGNNLVAIVKNFAYLDNGTLFEYTESHHRSDKFVFSSYAKR